MTSTLPDLLKSNPELGEAVKPIDVSWCGHLAIAWIDDNQSDSGVLSVDDRVDADTIYEIGSITKGITGVALAQEVLKGEIALDDTIGELLPFDDKSGFEHLQAITIEALATHTSGLPRIPNLGIWYAWKNRSNPYAQLDKARLGAALAKTKLHRPGSGNYSNLGFGLLGWILAHAQQTTYENFLRQAVLNPLGMERTTCLYPSTTVPNLAPALKKNGNGGHPWWFTEQTVGAGGLGSSLQEMTLLLNSLLHPEKTNLSEAIQLATTPRKPFLDDQQIGLGWLTQITDGQSILWHNGGTGCFSSFMGINKEKGRGVVLLLNRPLPDVVTEAGLNYLAV